jgi:hypothetical protein
MNTIDEDDDELCTASFLGFIAQRILWPPNDPNFYPVTNREVLAVVRAAAVPGLMERCGLKIEELYKDKDAEDAPSLVLGPMEVLRGRDASVNVYGASHVYKLSSVAAWTRRFSAARAVRDLAEMRREAAQQEREEIRAREAARQAARQAEQAAMEEAARRADPRYRIRELEKRLAEQEAREREEAARRVRELEQRLAGKDPPP